MAAKANITFTLPMSCQICLGKVKAPVLCPNYHVFCQLCLDIWLQRNNQCPACRVEIGADNQIKQIIGGQLAEEHQKCDSTPDLRRARLDLLYREYEDQLEGLKKENLVLRTENDIVSAQLREADQQLQTYKSGTSPNCDKPQEETTEKVDHKKPGLLQLTKNLKEAQKLYNEIKDEMSRLKSENTKLIDENVNLTRENEKLRLEIVQRSPKKYGRTTVATLESELAKSQKEVRQLTSALERSDKYTEELEHEIKVINEELKSSKPSKPPKSAIHQDKTFKTANHADETDGSSPDSARRTLFGKTIDDSQPITSTNSSVFKIPERKSEKPRTHLFGKPIPGEQISNSSDGNNGQKKSEKRVQFNVPGDTTSTSSLDLEMPSPFVIGAEMDSKPDVRFAFPLGRYKKTDKPLSEKASSFDKHVKQLLEKANSLSRSKPPYQDNDSSRLSLPDGNLDPDHLDISMTPELTDCLQLMDQAERNVQAPVSSSQISSSHISSTQISSSQIPSSHIVIKQEPDQLTTYVSSHMSGSSQTALQKQPPSHRVPPTSFQATPALPVGGGLTSSGTIWEKDFYSSVKANPYRHNSGSAGYTAKYRANDYRPEITAIKLEPQDTSTNPSQSHNYPASNTQSSSMFNHFPSQDYACSNSAKTFTLAEKSENLQHHHSGIYSQNTVTSSYNYASHGMGNSINNSDLDWPDDIKWPDEVDGDEFSTANSGRPKSCDNLSESSGNFVKIKPLQHSGAPRPTKVKSPRTDDSYLSEPGLSHVDDFIPEPPHKTTRR